ncbi:hypothetical protein [Oceanirhabdus seepicola]|nr:hypothetical protein [Oceanirhabdus seepicola]
MTKQKPSRNPNRSTKDNAQTKGAHDKHGMNDRNKAAHSHNQ